MYSRRIKYRNFNLGKNRGRTFTHKSSFTNLSNKKLSFEKINLDFCTNHIKTPQVNANVTESSWISDHFGELIRSFPDMFYTMKALFNLGSIEKTKPLISDYYLDAMINKLGNINININEIVSFNSFKVQEFTFSPHFLPVEGSFFHTIILLLNNRFIHLLFLCTIVYLMQGISTFLCYDTKSFRGLRIANSLEKCEVNRSSWSVINLSWFINVYNHIVRFSNRIERYLYNVSSHKLYHNILLKVYNSIRSLIVKFYFNLEFSRVNLISIKFNFGLSSHTLFRINMVLFAGPSLNILYAGLTPVYILLGWLLDYLSYIWTVNTSELNFRRIFTLSFWLKRFFFAILYITWLSLGVFSTNGIYFLVLAMISSINAFNIAIFVLGSVAASISSSFWFVYANPTVCRPFNVYRFLVNEVILPLVLRNSNIYDVLNLLSVRFSLSSNYFNNYTSLRRSVLEWVSFLSMVFSTYGSWNLYTVHVFNSMAVLYNFFIWTASSFIFAFILVYIEDSRPRFSNYYYGLTYISFWTSICFSTNSILLGYVTVSNAAYVLVYIIPINFILGFVYTLPLYRYNTNTTITARLLDVLFFVILTGVTLLSAGSVWYLIAPL